MAFVLANEIQQLARDFGIEKLGFLTLTFADNVRDIKEAQRRFHNLNRRVVSQRYARSIGVWERQQSGRIHFHLVVVLDSDIRTGFDFAAVERKDYRSANKRLRSEWAFWRAVAPRYRFGRTELLPVKSTAEGIARYVGKYVSKHIKQREKKDKGARVVRFIGFQPGTRTFMARFAWNTANGWLWRTKLKEWARYQDIGSMDELKELFGPRWAFIFADQILGTSVGDNVAPSRSAAERASNEHINRTMVRAARFDLLTRGQGRCYALRI